MYTPRELRHQLVDSGASVVLVLDNFGFTVQQALEGSAVTQVITTGLGDMLGFPKGAIVNFVLKYVKKMVPDYDIPDTIRLHDALALGQRQELPEVSIRVRTSVVWGKKVEVSVDISSSRIFKKKNKQ